MATAIWYHSTAGQDATPVLFEIFDEREYPIVKGPVDVSAPTQKDIYRFVFSIFKAEKLPAECAILCLAYIERLIANTKITLHGTNWRRVTLGALILASKVWEDQAVWNVDFLSVFPNVNVNDLNKLEKYFLGLLTYNVSLKASEYCKYYFELRELAEKDSKSFPLLPLTTADAQRLEQRAIETERRVKKLQRTSSADALPLKSPRALHYEGTCVWVLLLLPALDSSHVVWWQPGLRAREASDDQITPSAPKLSLRDGGANATAAPSPAKKSALPRHLQTLHFRREKSNSTSSLYVNSTISAPNLDQYGDGDLVPLHRGQDATPVLFEIFDEREYPIVKGPVDVSAPTQKDIYRFVFSIFKAEKLPAECAILCLAYIERLIANTKITLHGTNWRRVTLGALILASKVWEDQAVWNVDFLSVFPNVNVNDLNKLEKYFLGLLTYNVSLKASEYCKYYFELRELAEKDSKSFPLLPLTTADAQRLEQRAIETERRVKKLQRTSSADALPLKSPRAVLN
ncbi:cyclin, Nterminal domain containing protein [Acanthamoeba castellanii str. Neff]|uniref:Cyclin, Nterminal domain containing protein n=1 Tax=Acanthamoeba castellanii (strain ATCC 30010 / Neff) TaxID=1257118 RepID=L8H340_ACACF|nr:cyclin, Nterminal domain containing protein [Acanthamoeba castellanii str. Neff]ELR19600.1 cyclin, Nterminal domain containing protein [Acanthamoeba castellanii str. Neff]